MGIHRAMPIRAYDGAIIRSFMTKVAAPKCPFDEERLKHEQQMIWNLDDATMHDASRKIDMHMHVSALSLTLRA